MIHQLKTWTEYYSQIKTYKKRFEYRLDDRSYNVGDVLHLREYEPETGTYTGNELKVVVLYKLQLSDYAVLSISEPYDIKEAV